MAIKYKILGAALLLALALVLFLVPASLPGLPDPGPWTRDSGLKSAEPPAPPEILAFPMSPEGVEAALKILAGAGCPAQALRVLATTFYSTRELVQEMSYIAVLRCLDQGRNCLADYFLAMRRGHGKEGKCWISSRNIPVGAP